MLEEMTHWSDWVVVGLFGLFVLAAIGHLIQVFTGPHRIRAFFLALITPVMGGIIAMMVGALLHPGDDHRQTGAPSTATARALPTPEWAKDLLPMVESWIDAVDIDVSCVALDWQGGQRFIHCISGDHAHDLGKAGAITYGFELKDGVLYPHNGLTYNLLQEQKRKGRFPRFRNVRFSEEFLRAPGPDMMQLDEAIRQRLQGRR